MECLRIRPHGVFQVKQHDKIYFFTHRNVSYYKLFGEDIVGVWKSFFCNLHMCKWGEYKYLIFRWMDDCIKGFIRVNQEFFVAAVEIFV